MLQFFVINDDAVFRNEHEADFRNVREALDRVLE